MIQLSEIGECLLMKCSLVYRKGQLKTCQMVA